MIFCYKLEHIPLEANISRANLEVVIGSEIKSSTDFWEHSNTGWEKKHQVIENRGDR